MQRSTSLRQVRRVSQSRVTCVELSCCMPDPSVPSRPRLWIRAVDHLPKGDRRLMCRSPTGTIRLSLAVECSLCRNFHGGAQHACALPKGQRAKGPAAAQRAHGPFATLQRAHQRVGKNGPWAHKKQKKAKAVIAALTGSFFGFTSPLLIFSERSLGGAMFFSRVAPRFVRFGRRFSAVPMVSLTQHSAPLPKETFSLLGTDGTGWRRRDGVAARAPGLGLW